MEMDQIDQRQQDEINNLKEKDVRHEAVFEILKSELSFMQKFFVGLIIFQFFIIIITWALMIMSAPK